MAAPIWITPKGSLGTIEEQQFYELQMQAYDPDGNNEAITYKIVSGQLPPGLVMSEAGTIEGQPETYYKIRGVPFDVTQDITSTFCCRAINTSTNQLTDRTFSITVTGQDIPDLVTPPSELGRYLDGTYAEIQLSAVDLDNEPIAWRISAGTLPPGLVIDTSTGLISGYIRPAENYELSNKVGWSTDIGWEEYPWDYGSRAISANYQFTVEVTDGKGYDKSAYTIFVYSHDSLTADNDILTSDHSQLITADADVKRRPVLLTEPADLGTYAHDNYFAYRFEGLDFDNDVINFSLLVGEGLGFDNEANGFDSTLLDFGNFSTPPGLTLNTQTGWLHGQIPSTVIGQTEYTFAVRVYKRDYPTYQSNLTYFTMTIINDMGKLITWVTPNDLGTMFAGDISEKYVAARNERNINLLYSLESGRLPQGLVLNPDGLIVGRSSFEVGSFDRGTTTFDKNTRELGFLSDETTFDRVSTFTVKASDSNEQMVAFRTFSIGIDPRQYDPYETLYLRAQPGLSDKGIILSIFNNTDVIPNADLYRASDPYFGRARDLRMLLMSGVNASTVSEYIDTMLINHYRKILKLGNYTWAQALNDDGSVAYEIVYVPLIDDLDGAEYRVSTLATDASAIIPSPADVDLNKDLSLYTIADNDSIDAINDLAAINGSNNLYAYPNSLANMRRIVRQILGQQGKEPLPRWMTSKQSNGRILGWQAAVPVAYVKPGAGAKVVFNLNRRAPNDIKDVSFEVDRYIWDMNLSRAYDANTDTYLTSVETTFDAVAQAGPEPLNYTFACDGSTVEFDLGVQIEDGIITVMLEQYVASVDESSLVLTRNGLAENVDYTRSGSLLTLSTPPSENSTLIVSYTSSTVIEVDYAVSVPFTNIDGRTINYIDDVLGGLDGIIDTYVGRKIVFAQQENYSGFVGEEDGWIRYGSLWDSEAGWDDDAGWDDYEIIPGYVESITSSLLNQRAAVWTITRGDNDEIRLEVDQYVDLGGFVAVRNGSQYGGRILRYGPLIIFSQNETVPRYNYFEDILDAQRTTFDAGSTRFMSNISIYQDPDEGDKYLAFPRTNIWA